RKKLLDTFGAQVSSDHERYPADVKCLGFLYLYVGRYPRNNASRNTLGRKTHMSAFKLLFLLFLLVPVVEIYFLITVGSAIGAWFTVFLVIGTAIIGAFFVRQQGISVLFRFQREVQEAARRDDPSHESAATATAMLEGVLILVAGALLLTPGFLTDAVGFICLVPPWRRGLISRFLPPRWNHTLQARTGVSPYPRNPGGGSIIEGNFRREDE
ncbi:MAG: UPF0716 protein FxsA, partial [Candidatus Kentron sp. G]